MFAIAVLLVFLTGYATQRGSVCAVTATWELVVERKASRYVGFGFCAACGLLAMAIGNASGRPVFDPSVYYFYKIPTIVDPFTVAWVTGGAVLIAVLASVLPARRAALLHPVQALRFE